MHFTISEAGDDRDELMALYIMRPLFARANTYSVIPCDHDAAAKR